MGDDIESAAEFFELAMLREIVVHELVAGRVPEPNPDALGLPPEELQAPDSVDDDAALSFTTRLEWGELGIRCRIETCNAYASFAVDAEAVFDLPATVSALPPDTVREFTAQVGAPTVFPYIRAAVASLAAHLAVPASPLSVLLSRGVGLTRDDEPAEEEPSEFFMRGTFSTTTASGEQVEIAEFFLDPHTGTITRLGGEGDTPDLDEMLDVIAELPPAEQMSAEWFVRQHGEAWARAAMEQFRETEGDAYADAALAEIDAAVAAIEVEDAVAAMKDAVIDLDGVIASTRGEANSEHEELIEAAERVRDGWMRVGNALSD